MTDDLRALAEAWLADDPDPVSRDELRDLIAGLPATADELRDRFAGPLTFGTAGLRGRLRAGPNGMNLAVVTRAAAGLVGWLQAQGARLCSCRGHCRHRCSRTGCGRSTRWPG